MKLKYQTGVATLTQFIIMTVLNFLNGLVASWQACTVKSGDCLSNVILSLLYFLFISLWFALVAFLGYAAQDRRSRRLAQLLIIAEGLIVLFSLFDARHWTNVIGLITSLVDATLALWVIVLAWRLMRAGGSRIVASSLPRRRHKD